MMERLPVLKMDCNSCGAQYPLVAIEKQISGDIHTVDFVGFYFAYSPFIEGH